MSQRSLNWPPARSSPTIRIASPGLEVRRHALQVDVGLEPEREHRLGRARAQLVPLGARVERLDRLERLRPLARPGHALDLRARIGTSAVCGAPHRALDGEREVASRRRRRGSARSRSRAPARAPSGARSRCAGTPRWRSAPGRRSARRRRSPRRRAARSRSRRARACVERGAAAARSAVESAGEHARAGTSRACRRGRRAPAGPGGSSIGSGVCALDRPQQQPQVVGHRPAPRIVSSARRARGSSGRCRAARSPAGRSRATPSSSSPRGGSPQRWKRSTVDVAHAGRPPARRRRSGSGRPAGRT